MKPVTNSRIADRTHFARSLPLLGVRLRGLSPRSKQRLGGAVAAALVGSLALAQSHLAHEQQAASLSAAKVRAQALELAAMRAEVARMRAGFAALDASVQATTARIEARQTAIAAVIGTRGAVQLASADIGPATPGARPVRVAFLADPAALLAPLARLESNQLALVAEGTSAARARYASATATIRNLGLDPRRFVRATSVGQGGFGPATLAMGGPLEPAPADAAAAPGAQVLDLWQAWTRLGQLGQAAAAIPSRMPVANFNYTSGFGVRYDPFNGGAATHAGVDMAGVTGEAILSAAQGTVVRAGWQGGYGNCIDIDHGRGMSTRYGHLSRIQVHVGDRVVAGDRIGLMGSTGRSTGSHLHFEVRVDGRAVDPMPYLRATTVVAQLQSTAPGALSTVATVGAPVAGAVGVGGPALR